MEKITCHDCGVEIVEYRHDGYGGNRGRCPKCKTDFPLE